MQNVDMVARLEQWYVEQYAEGEVVGEFFEASDEEEDEEEEMDEEDVDLDSLVEAMEEVLSATAVSSQVTSSIANAGARVGSVVYRLRSAAVRFLTPEREFAEDAEDEVEEEEDKVEEVGVEAVSPLVKQEAGKLWNNKRYSGRKYTFDSPGKKKGKTDKASPKKKKEVSAAARVKYPATRMGDGMLTILCLLGFALVYGLGYFIIHPEQLPPGAQDVVAQVQEAIPVIELPEFVRNLPFSLIPSLPALPSLPSLGLSVTYCDTGSGAGPSEGCVPCPARANCVNGVAKCLAKEHVVRDGMCVGSALRNATIRDGAQIAREVVYDLAGAWMCGSSPVRGINDSSLQAAVVERMAHPPKAALVPSVWKDIVLTGFTYVPENPVREEGGTFVFRTAMAGDGTDGYQYPDGVMDVPGARLYWSSKGDANRDVLCVIREGILSFLWAHVLEIVGAVVVVGGFLKWRASSAQASREAAEAADLYQRVMGILYDEDRSLAVSHIKNMLFAVTDHKEQGTIRVWDKTVALVRSNPSVRETHRKVHGETELVWEWMSDLPPHGYVEAQSPGGDSIQGRELFPGSAGTSPATSPPPPFDSPHYKMSPSSSRSPRSPRTRTSRRRTSNAFRYQR